MIVSIKDMNKHDDALNNVLRNVEEAELHVNSTPNILESSDVEVLFDDGTTKTYDKHIIRSVQDASNIVLTSDEELSGDAEMTDRGSGLKWWHTKSDGERYNAIIKKVVD